MSLVRGWILVVVVFVALYGAIVIQVSVLLFQHNGQHTPSSELIIADDSVEQCVVEMNNTTSLSQFGVETLPGLIVILTMSLFASFILISIERDGLPRDRIWGNLVGYAACGLIGIFTDELPGSRPRRNWNFVLLWPVASSTTNIIHVTCAAVFLFLPILSTARWLYHHPNRWWIAAYVFAFCLNVSYGAADLWVSGNALLPGEWFLYEGASFGVSFILFASFGIWKSNNSLSATSYAPLKRRTRY